MHGIPTSSIIAAMKEVMQPLRPQQPFYQGTPLVGQANVYISGTTKVCRVKMNSS
jgi:glutamate-1-semialdehyde aminotransferase